MADRVKEAEERVREAANSARMRALHLVTMIGISAGENVTDGTVEAWDAWCNACSTLRQAENALAYERRGAELEEIERRLRFGSFNGTRIRGEEPGVIAVDVPGEEVRP